MITINKISAATIDSLLAKKYAAPVYAYISQVRNATGYAPVARTADAIVMSLWPSRGLELIGFEIKISRSDWIKELQTPEKADVISKYCDRWYVVVSNRNIVQTSELPPNWGLMVFDIDKLKVVTEAPLLKPLALDKPFLAAILRRAWEITVSDIKIEDARQEGYEQGYKYGKEMMDDQLNTLVDYINEFQTKSGIDIRAWDRGRVADAVKILINADPRSLVRQFESSRNFCSVHTRIFDDAIDNLKKLYPTLVEEDNSEESE